MVYIAGNTKVHINLFFTLVFIICTVVLSCNHADTKTRLSSGNTLEIITVINKNADTEKTLKELDEVFSETQPALNQPEPMFDVIYIRENVFNNIFSKHHNIFIINYNKSVKKEGFVISKDKYAKPQIVVELNAKTEESLYSLLRANKESLRKIFKDSEIRRIGEIHTKYRSKDIANSILSTYNIKMVIPESYYIASKNKNTIWLRNKNDDGENGILISTVSYSDTAIFYNDGFIVEMNRLLRDNIIGERDSSYMKICEYPKVLRAETSVGGLYAAEFRGLWDTENDAMGGCFIGYAVCDEKNRRIINFYGYVYRPNLTKRDLLMQLETMIKTVKF